MVGNLEKKRGKSSKKTKQDNTVEPKKVRTPQNVVDDKLQSIAELKKLYAYFVYNQETDFCRVEKFKLSLLSRRYVDIFPRKYISSEINV